MNLIVIFPWGIKKEIYANAEHVASGGCWSYVQAFRALGHNVSMVNLYNEAEQFDPSVAVSSITWYLNQGKKIDAAIVFDFGNVKLEYQQIFGSIPVIYHAGDDPMRFEGNRDIIREGQIKRVLCAQKPFCEKYKEEFPDIVTEWVPYHYDSFLHYYESYNKMYDFVFLGKIYGEREPYLKFLKSKGISFKTGFGLFGHEYRKALLKGKYGWHHAWCGEVGYRHFEIPAIGLALVCDRLAPSYGLSDLIPEDLRFSYSSQAECLEVMKKIDVDKNLRATVAEKCSNYVREKHGSLQRAVQIIDFIKKN